MRKKRRYIFPKNLLLFFILLSFSMGVGYAAISQSLSVNSQVNMNLDTWSIYFSNPTVTSGSVNASSPSCVETVVSFSAQLEFPGDFYEFTVELINAGNFDAKLASMTITPSMEDDYFSYTVTYSDGTPIHIGDALSAYSTEVIRIRVEYLVSSDISSYPDSDTVIPCSVNMNYVYGHGNAVRHDGMEIFSTSNLPLYFGQTVNPQISFSRNVVDAIDDFGHPACISTVLANGVPDALYAYFVLNGSYYTLNAGGSTYNETTGKYNNDSIYYDDNVATLLSLISPIGTCSYLSNGLYCTYKVNEDGEYQANGTDVIAIMILKQGHILIMQTDSSGQNRRWWCYAFNPDDSGSLCEVFN